MWILLVVLLAVSLSVSTVSGQEQRESQLPRIQARQLTNGDLTTAVCMCGYDGVCYYRYIPVCVACVCCVCVCV